MIRERVTITIACDRRGCISSDRVENESRDECNRRLFVLGWRKRRDKQLCPQHAEQDKTPRRTLNE